MRKTRSLRTTVLAVACSLSMTVFAQGGEPKPIDIPSGDLISGLRALTQQSGAEFVYREDQLSGLKTKGVRGTLTAEEALARLLEGSGYTVKRDPSGVLMIIKKASAGVSQPDPVSQRPDATETKEEVTDFETIIVTGTNIRGQAPVGSRPIVIQREELQSSGYGTVQDYLTTLPQNFGSQLADVRGGAGNFTRGTAINLRGLGAGATLTLIDGRRVASSGDNGDFVDISSIPAAAIERIEVLTDGASAIYGADAVGGVVNLVLRHDFEGLEANARIGTADGSDEHRFSLVGGKSIGRMNFLLGYQYYRRSILSAQDRDFSQSADKRRFGGTDFRTDFSNPGNMLAADGQPAFAIPAGQDGSNLTVGQLLPGTVNLGEPNQGLTLLPRNRSHNLFGTMRWQALDALELFIDGRYSRREFSSQGQAATSTLSVPTTNPFYIDPFGTTAPVRIRYNFIDDFGNPASTGESRTASATFGGRLELPSSWEINSFVSYGRNRERTRTETINFTALNQALANPDPAITFNPFADGSATPATTLAAIQSSNLVKTRSQIQQVNAVADGPLLSLPAGEARLAVGFDYRAEALQSAANPDRLSRDVWAAFGELYLPLLSRGDGARPMLAASLAGRYDRYSDFGDAFSPRVGITFSPVDALSFRGTWGKSFRAPKLLDLDERIGSSTIVFPLSRPAGDIDWVILRLGNNSELGPERATSWTFGVDFTPRSFLDGARLSLTYFDIDYQDRIIRPGPSPLEIILFQEALWSEIIDRQPDPAELNALCDIALTVISNCAATPPVAIVDGRVRNIAAFRSRGVDVEATYHFSWRRSEIDLFARGTYAIDLKQRLTTTSPTIQLIDTFGNPPELRLRAGANWQLGPWSVNAAVNHTGGYDDNSTGTMRPVSAWTTVDAGIAYRTKLRDLSEWEVALRAVNLFNRSPPFVDNAFGFDAANASALGRFVTFELRKSW